MPRVKRIGIHFSKCFFRALNSDTPRSISSSRKLKEIDKVKNKNVEKKGYELKLFLFSVYSRKISILWKINWVSLMLGHSIPPSDERKILHIHSNAIKCHLRARNT